ncbi:hypothetical protein [Spiroplasma alleghenense]|uniref:PTS EIIB type-1 domain-containing protein n=1 Tax=Spiroplasma alleghenense TaxID=216931 RepID=A0A345Z4G5_9MOLU|nr:hypothetical protein [Spiroplasma alleghenense]AXK51494.1 hypothetical protein SALLE_v1c08240 [Spiroplasma alleghenense]
MLIVWLVMLIVAVVIAIWSIIYLFIRKGFYTNFNKNNKDPNFKKNIFKYDNILDSVGGLDNIQSIETINNDCCLKLFSNSLMDQKRLKKLGIKSTLSEDSVVLSLKDYNFNTFVLKTKRLLKNMDS